MNIVIFINVIREEDLLYWFTNYVQTNLVDRIPDDYSIDKIDYTLTNVELVRLVRCFINDDGDAAIADQVLDEIVNINRIFYCASNIFHGELVEFGCSVEMYDELFVIFAPLFFERFDRLMFN